MNKTRKAICLLPIGLLCAAFVYPFLHELGHGLVVFLLGAKVVELQWFPLPSILCRMSSIGATEYVVAGMGGIIFPAALCLLIRCNRKFWIWYAVFIVRLICIWSLLLAAISIVLFKFGILLSNDDMTQILQIYPQQWWVCGVLIVVMCLSLCISMAKSKPIQRIVKEL